jgi:hypothetical protein
MSNKVNSKSSSLKKNSLEPHHWRLCPYGEHWVITHPMRVPPSEKNPNGSITTRKGHCAKNPSGKDQLYPDEIKTISDSIFKELKNKPCSLDLNFKNGSQFDDLIAGWTQYWNEVLQPKVPLSCNIVKALIASESGFKADLLANKKNSNTARGLMQILNSTRKTLGDEKSELQNHFLTVTKDELNDPSINICSGIRWLFQKHKLASSYLEREASWEEAVMHYKGKLKTKAGDKESLKQKKIFNDYLSRLEKCEN